MVIHSLKTHRMIGVIQPKNNNNELFQVGCIGKITSYIETPDYRIVLNLEGITRFVLEDRELSTNGYYQANVNYEHFPNDLDFIEPHINRSDLIQKKVLTVLGYLSLIEQDYQRAKHCKILLKLYILKSWINSNALTTKTNQVNMTM